MWCDCPLSAWRVSALATGPAIGPGPAGGQVTSTELPEPDRSHRERAAAMKLLIAPVTKQIPVAIEFLIVPVTKLDPLVPPTFTRTPLSGATAAPTSTSTPAPTTMSLPTSSPTTTSTALPCETPTALVSPTPSPTPRPTATQIACATVGGTDRDGANVRRAPGLTAAVTGVPDGALLQFTERRAEAEALARRLCSALLSWVAACCLPSPVGPVCHKSPVSGRSSLRTDSASAPPARSPTRGRP